MPDSPQTLVDRITAAFQRQTTASPRAAQTMPEFLAGVTSEEIEKLRKNDQDSSLANLVQEWFTRCRNARSAQEIIWYKSLDMYAGRQFTEWDANKRTMVETPTKDGELRLAVNIIEPTCRTEMAKTGTNKPTATVVPASNDIEDILAAEAGTAAYEWWHSAVKFQTHFNDANFWRTVTGTGFIKVFYDSSAEDPAAAAAKQQASAAPGEDTTFGRIVSQLEPPKPSTVKGLIQAEAVTPFNLYVPNLAITMLQKQPYVLHAYTIPVETAKLRYGSLLPDGWEPPTSSLEQIIDLTHLGIVGGNAAPGDEVMVIEAYVKPGYHASLPHGGLLITVGGQLVYSKRDGLPYEHGEYPFSMLTGIDTGRFYRKSVVESITDLQKELNRVFAQIIKHRTMAGKPMMVYDEGSLDPKKIRAVAGQWIPVRLGMNRPTPIPLQELPAFVAQFIDRIKQFLDDISGQHQVSRAISPGADTAASALSLLQETDDNFLSTTFDSIDSMMETVGRQVLSLMVQFWDEPRLVKVAGFDNTFSSRMLKGADLRNGTDLRTESASDLPSSKAARNAQITEWMDKGYIPPELGLEAMGTGTLGKVRDRIRVDRAQAQRENEEMRALDPSMIAQYNQQQLAMQQQQAADAAAQGMDPMQAVQPQAMYPINWFDNDAVHIEEHKFFAKGQAFKALPPEVQKVFEQHVTDHEARAAQMMMQQMMLANGGTPGAPGGGAPDGGAPDGGAPDGGQPPQFA